MAETTTTTTLDDALARRLLFGEATVEETEWGFDEGLEPYYAWLKLRQVQINQQLADYNEGAFVPDDANWRRRAISMKRHVDAAVVTLTPVLKTQRRERNNVGRDREVTTVLDALRRARGAIHRHRESTLADGIEPTDADLDLWKVVDDEDDS